MKQIWLFKSEPHVYSIDQLKKDGKTLWTGVRNYQARNFLQKCQTNDIVLFYHSHTKKREDTGIAGLGFISAVAVSDPTFQEEKNPWVSPEVQFKEKFLKIISLESLKQKKGLEDFLLFKQSRLSVMPVTEKQLQIILK